MLVVPTGQSERTIGRLSAREARVLELAVEGQAMKVIADALEVSQSTTYALLTSGLSKLGVQGVADLTTIARALPKALLCRFGCGSSTLVALGLPTALIDAYPKLTPAERHIVPQLLASKAIPRSPPERNTAVRTIANQVVSIYRKLGVSDRVELALRFSPQ